MHFLPTLVVLLTLKVAFIYACGGPRRLFHFVRDLLTIGKDHWTWTTRSGEWFEDAEIEAIEDGELVLKHRYGVVRVAIDGLSEQSRNILFHTQKWADYLADSKELEKAAPFASAPVAQAA